MASVDSEHPVVSSPSFDPFSPPTIQVKVHKIRFTLIEGLGSNPYVDTSAVLKLLKRHLGCGGMIVDDPEAGESIVLQGDQRARVARFLTDEEHGPCMSHRFVKLVGRSDSQPPPPPPRSPRSPLHLPRSPQSPRSRRRKKVHPAHDSRELARLGLGDV